MKSSVIYNFFTSYDIVTSTLPAIRALNDSQEDVAAVRFEAIEQTTSWSFS